MTTSFTIDCSQISNFSTVDCYDEEGALIPPQPRPYFKGVTVRLPNELATLTIGLATIQNSFCPSDSPSDSQGFADAIETQPLVETEVFNLRIRLKEEGAPFISPIIRLYTDPATREVKYSIIHEDCGR